eukprot:1147165-Pelagomonas_calceolata.AAC.2
MMKKKKEEEEEEEFGMIRSNQYSIRTTRWVWRLCCADLSLLPMPVLTKPAPQGLLLRALMIILPAILWRSVSMLEMI